MAKQKVANGWFYTLMSDKNTGHILNKDKSINTSEEQDHYYIFPSFKEATIYAKKAVSDDSSIEIIIYDHLDKFLKIYD